MKNNKKVYLVVIFISLITAILLQQYLVVIAIKKEKIYAVKPTEDVELLKKDEMEAEKMPLGGTFGTTKWSFNEVTGELTISAGTFENSTEAHHLPWSDFKDSVNKITIEGTVYAAPYSDRLFGHMSNLTSIEGLAKLDVSNMESMQMMFSGNSSLKNGLDVSGWDTSKVRSMAYAFAQVSGVSELDVSDWDTSNVTNMVYTFSGVSGVSELDVSGWDTSKVTNMSNTFNGVSGVSELDVSGWDTSNVTSLASTFNGVSRVSELDVSGWDTSKVTNMSNTFNGVSGVSELDVSGWDTSNVTSLAATFNGVSRVSELDVSGWDTSNVTDVSYAFSGVSGVSKLDVSHWDTSKVTNMSNTFSGVSGVSELDVSGWDTSNVTNMPNLFGGVSGVSELDVSHWDTSKVTNMKIMFSKMQKLKTISLGPQFKFFPDADLPAIEANQFYTGKWIGVNTRTVFNSSEALMTNYTGENADTYLWEEAIRVTDIQIIPSAVNLSISETFQLRAVVLPEDATNTAVSWISSDSRVAEVSDSGLVTGKSPGTVVITGETQDGGYKAISTITIVDEGILKFSQSVDVLNFQDILISTQDIIVKRETQGPMVTVLDTRWTKDPYSIQVTLEQPLTSQSGNITLPDALIFVHPSGSIETLSEINLEIFHHQPIHSQSSQAEEVDVEWESTKGILLRIQSKERVPSNYSGLLRWTLISGP